MDIYILAMRNPMAWVLEPSIYQNPSYSFEKPGEKNLTIFFLDFRKVYHIETWHEYVNIIIKIGVIGHAQQRDMVYFWIHLIFKEFIQ